MTNENMQPRGLAKLIVDAKSGDEKDQEELYRRFEPMIHHMARKMNWNDWEDARQELICELLLAVQRFEPQGNLGNHEQ